MFECLILGDSIGVGIAREINIHAARHCDVMAAEGATTDQILTWPKPTKTYGTSIFAMSSNDEPNAAVATELTRLRSSVSSRRVIWLLPYSRARALIVSSVALSFGDETVDLTRFQTKDHVHPLHYHDLAKVLLK